MFLSIRVNKVVVVVVYPSPPPPLRADPSRKYILTLGKLPQPRKIKGILC